MYQFTIVVVDGVYFGQDDEGFDWSKILIFLLLCLLLETLICSHYFLQKFQIKNVFFFFNFYLVFNVMKKDIIVWKKKNERSIFEIMIKCAIVVKFKWYVYCVFCLYV